MDRFSKMNEIAREAVILATENNDARSIELLYDKEGYPMRTMVYVDGRAFRVNIDIVEIYEETNR